MSSAMPSATLTLRTSLACHAHRPGLRQFVALTGVVPYHDTGRVWIAAGDPVMTRMATAQDARDDAIRCAQLALHFVDAAQRARRRTVFFGATPALLASPVGAQAFRALPIGAEPVWNPQDWAASVRGHRSVRENCRRARAKGVTVRWITDDFQVTHSETRAALRALLARWYATRRMPPMHFVATVSLDAVKAPQRVLIAERGSTTVGVLLLSPVPGFHTALPPSSSPTAWVIEHYLRDPAAPPGTMNFLIDAAMRVLADEGVTWTSLGMAPLAGDVPRWMRTLGSVARPLYDFDGVTTFKQRLRPQQWVPALLAVPRTQSLHRGLLDTVGAFAGGSLGRAMLRAAHHAAVRHSLMRR